MVFKRGFYLIAAAFFAGVTMAVAQESEPTLRELAEENGISIGAAAWTYHLDNPQHAETLAREFNVLTPEHEAKHCEVERQRGQFNFQNVDQLVEFAEENDMDIHGHTLVWHSCMPRWISNGDFTRDEAIGLLRDYIMTMVGRYQGRIPVWDVVNEAIADDGSGLRDTPWLQLIGEDYIELAFRFAHEADPDALLFYNDYGAEEMNAKSDAVYEMAADFIERGVPIHGVGMQAHFTTNRVNERSIAENVARLGELGLQVQFTELDIRHPGPPTEAILNRQALDYADVVNVCLSSPNCTAVIMWGVSDQYTWLRGANLGFFENPEVAPLLFNDDYEPKPAYFSVQDALAIGTGG